MNIDSVIAAYRRYANVYDFIFGPIMHPGRKRVVERLGCRPGDRVLEVGVGTGLSLPLYPSGVKVTGIDVSREMLLKAERRLRDLSLSHEVLEMDAERMEFEDGLFDKVVAMYVVSVVPDPQRMIREIRRVCKSGGDIFIVNHFRSAQPVARAIEGMFSPFSQLAGFRPDLELEQFLDESGLDVVDVSGTNLFGYWKVVHCHNVPAPQLQSEEPLARVSPHLG